MIPTFTRQIGENNKNINILFIYYSIRIYYVYYIKNLRWIYAKMGKSVLRGHYHSVVQFLFR